jgi:hypothetical protein
MRRDERSVMMNETERKYAMYKWIIAIPVLTLFLLSFSVEGGFAQNPANSSDTALSASFENEVTGAIADQDAKVDLRDDLMLSVESELQKLYAEDMLVEPPNIPSLFFTTQEHALLNEAREGFKARLPTLKELGQSGVANRLEYESEEEAARMRAAQAALRELSLSGILYISQDDWIVWLNKTRMTPDALPKEIMDIKVYNEYVELRWFDLKTKTIYPVRLRPNQRFNLDARMFLPG